MSRAARKLGRRDLAANGSTSPLSTELNTKNTFERGYGVMFEPEPCSRFASNHSAVPAGPVNWSMPRSSQALTRVS